MQVSRESQTAARTHEHMVCVFPRKEEGHLLPVAEPARHLDKSHAGPRPQRELPARRSRGQTFAPPGRRLSRPHWPLRPGVLHEKQTRPRLRHPSCCLIAHLEIRCSETQETNTWSPEEDAEQGRGWVVRSLELAIQTLIYAYVYMYIYR